MEFEVITGLLDDFGHVGSPYLDLWVLFLECSRFKGGK